MLKRGIKDFAYRVYDRELVVLESDWQNGQHETLSQASNDTLVTTGCCSGHSLYKHYFENLSK